MKQFKKLTPPMLLGILAVILILVSFLTDGPVGIGFSIAALVFAVLALVFSKHGWRQNKD